MQNLRAQGDPIYGGSGNEAFRVGGAADCGSEGYDGYDGGTGTDRIVAYGSRGNIGLSTFDGSNGISIFAAAASKCGISAYIGGRRARVAK